jgi:hypothetical protein
VTAQTAARVILDFLGAIFKAREARGVLPRARRADAVPA